MSTQFSAVGSIKTYYSFLNSLGYALGSGTSLANGASSGAGQILAVNSIAIPIPPARPIAVTGDNTLIGSVLIPGNTVAAGTMVTSTRNPTLANKSIGLVTETLGSTVDLETFGTPCPVFTSFTLIDSAPGFNSSGIAGYETIFWFNCQLFPLEETAITDSATHQFTHNIKANPVTVRPWGASLTVATNGTSKALGQKVFAAYPALLMSFVGDGVTTTLTLDQAPTVGIVIPSVATDTLLWDNGTIKTQASGAGNFTVSGSTVTFGTAPVAGHFIEVLYFYAPNC